jgi:hypothetical protein
MNFRKVAYIAAFAALVLAVTLVADDNEFDLKALAGSWQGEGVFVMPVTDIEMDIEGEAEFEYDKTNNWLRTQITGTKFMFSYSDSGHIARVPKTDSVWWEVWDNFGRHSKYFGKVDRQSIFGQRRYGSKLYEVRINQIHPDTIDFKLTMTPDGEGLENRATFRLWRVNK